MFDMSKSKKTSFSGDAAGTAAAGPPGAPGAAGDGRTGLSVGGAGRVTGVSPGRTPGAPGASGAPGAPAPGPTAPGPAEATSGRLGQPRRAREPTSTPTVNRMRTLDRSRIRSLLSQSVARQARMKFG